MFSTEEETEYPMRKSESHLSFCRGKAEEIFKGWVRSVIWAKFGNDFGSGGKTLASNALQE